MKNNEFQTLGMTQHMLREFRAQCNHRAAEALKAQQIQLDYPQFAQELLTYPLFTNPACGNQTGEEFFNPNAQEEHCRRWLHFFTPDANQLPQEAQWQAMEQQLALLKHRYRSATSPRLAAFTAAMLTLILLLMRGHFLLATAPIAAVIGYWMRTEQQAKQARQDLLAHLAEMDKLHTQKENLLHQFASLPPPAEQTDFHQRYQQAKTRLLQNTLLHLLRPHQLGDLNKVLKQQQWVGFINESWGYLQIPLKAQRNSKIARLLLDEQQPTLMALQTEHHERSSETLFRVQYVHLWLLTPSGLLLGYAYYDRVTDQFLYEQHEFHPYSQLTHIRTTEQPLPEHSVLKERLPETLYRRYFRQPLSVLSIGTNAGKLYECALTSAAEDLAATQRWNAAHGLDSDVSHLSRQLHQRVHGSTAAVA